MSEEKGLIRYIARDGQVVELKADIVRKYLVSGKRELVTDQEIYVFMGLCQARGLNPITRDCYLLKYSADPAAIIVSIEFLRARARAQADCTGWQCGPVCVGKDGQLRYSNGLVLPGETLVGGWFEAQPVGWTAPFRLEVNLSGFVKPGPFWRDNPAFMIAKVAESQGLRRLWPQEFGKLFTAEEVDNGQQGEMVELEPMPPEPPNGAPDFHALVNAHANGNLNLLAACAAYVTALAAHSKTTEAAIHDRAARNFDKFWEAFTAWHAAQRPAPAPEPPSEASPTNGAIVDASFEVDPPEATTEAQDAPASKRALVAIKKSIVTYGDRGLSNALVFQRYSVNSLDELTETQAQKCLDWIDKEF